ncbi:MAG: bifunctional phosphoribosylaminoimidazolecarboxamide formyltransferase/IMP cyclohydrolase [Clostridium sp.]|uniref:bifunctional phosphoribosylaminoimidazolecarboxamide formyltransferase/IMP cyclohydrolase n=1 Tax=Clostridium culturomicium TaxID=1499683 RepID=UPI00058FC6ED|nr:bifunctional phosphoribosylaminoimidazolecarboxamide formyltransferase/IMP cyclohydrolase [Clostridium culturomicium]MDU4891305.1 bifunctional phosphoribosylaminoimidazolecarboxamide formyltransferase/IMP cyclohydrolase [Clostridium sp.]MDU7085135.1 bifunctional phosphoribosylaminoimidazolecarboxamide formyltransferase/IMP cyclohydrolase [Clostridium sp.]
MIKRALISVYDKTGIVDFTKFLRGQGIEIISTGGTYKLLQENNIEVKEVAEVTKAAEMLDGRVKTLHPVVHGGILAIRDNEEHMNTLKEREIDTIDLVCVNLYPFFEKAREGLSFEDTVEFIDIGGPTMLRSAAKNFKDVVVICDAADYSTIAEEISSTGQVSFETRKKLAMKVFNLTTAYDSAICEYLLNNCEEKPSNKYLALSYEKFDDLRYGENPHQEATVYTNTNKQGMLNNIEILNGKALSYNNIKDMDIAWKVVNEFEEIACCGLKHNSPCGVALGSTAFEAYTKAFSCDEVSIFGGIVAVNTTVTKEAAEEMKKTFLEIVIAPGFEEEALEVLKTKKNLRIIRCTAKPSDKKEVISVDGGILVQDTDKKLVEDIKVVTEAAPTKEQMDDMIFGMKVCKYVKSNAIVVVKDGMAKGIAGGQVNRIWATEQAIERAGDGVVLASDAFFPFRDCVDEAHKNGIRAIIQPGGSVRDQESIDACNEYGIPMVFTGIRHFKH